MRIAFVTPWFRSLAHLYGAALERAGHSVLVVSTESHFEPGYGLCDELTVRGKAAAGGDQIRELRNIRDRLKEFNASVTIEDVFRDPRWLALTHGMPRRHVMIHDPAPHDSRHRVGGLKNQVSKAQLRGSSGIVAFSEYAQKEITGSARIPVYRVPLLSEMPDDRVRRKKDSGRHGFLVIGRPSPYKGVDIALEAWRRIPADRRESLTLILSEGPKQSNGALGDLDDEGLFVHEGRFAFDDVTDQIASSRAVLLPYRSASQSGVQLLSMQHAVAPLVHGIGGLAEYQPDAIPAIETLDPEAWCQRMEHLLDDQVADTAGLEALKTYRSLTDDSRLMEAFTPMLARSSP
jgi:glycosyltransferase involved in cell wall biosynthesis